MVEFGDAFVRHSAMFRPEGLGNLQAIGNDFQHRKTQGTDHIFETKIKNYHKTLKTMWEKQGGNKLPICLEPGFVV